MLMDEIAAVKDVEIRDGLDTELSGQGWFGLGVDFEYDGLAGHFLGEEFEFGGGHLAGSTPGRPEIYEDGDGRRFDDFGNGGGIDGEGFGEGGEGCLTVAAPAAMGEMGGGDAVRGRALGAGGD